ncbi:MAG: hypothetical protein QME96_12935 [Myxococcota bacterium]|nr:hypothetical protein [Myxococcota bacterium]
MTVRDEAGTCTVCGKPMHVQKSIPRQGSTLAHGTFTARETVYVCPAGRHGAEGPFVTRRAQVLRDALLPGRSVGYDVMALVGRERYLRHRQREEIQETLLREHGIVLSTGTISDLARLFAEYLGALHLARAERLRTAMQRDGGWPLHIDATGENGRGTLLVAYAGWRGWVLGAWRIPTERTDAILPRLREVAGVFGAPCAIVRDLGRAMIPAAAAFVAELGLPIPILSCHAHFLGDVGRDLLDAGHDALRGLFRAAKVRPDLRLFAREIGRSLGEDIPRVREAVAAWTTTQEGGHALPDQPTHAIGVLRALAQWVLDYAADSSGADFPFDRPYLDLYDRCLHARRVCDAFLRSPPVDRSVLRAIGGLVRVLDRVDDKPDFAQIARSLCRRAELFDELRSALRLFPAWPAGVQPPRSIDEPHEIQDIQAAVERLTASLRERRPQRGPAQDTRQAVDEVLAHLDRHGSSLWGHVISLPDEAGGGIRLVPRTNNILEGLHRAVKQGERRRCGRKVLTNDFEHLPPQAVLARNLLRPDYVEIVCGTLDDLPRAFAELDAHRRQRAPSSQLDGGRGEDTDTPEVATASLPSPDRRLVRTPNLVARFLAAARSRAPRISNAAVAG